MPAAFNPGWQAYATPYTTTPYYAQQPLPWSPNTPLWAPGSPPRAQYAQFGPGWHTQGAHPPPSPRAPRPTLAVSKYPNLNPMIAVDTSILRFDLRTDPAAFAAHYPTQGRETAVQNVKGPKFIRLLSKDFPWQIDIKPIEGLPVTCLDVWRGLYESLHRPIVDSEWGFIVNTQGAWERVEAARKKRVEVDRNSPQCALRIDFLGEATHFRGLEKDDDYAKKRWLPSHDSPKCEENWMVRLTT